MSPRLVFVGYSADVVASWVIVNSVPELFGAILIKSEVVELVPLSAHV